jgi:hypothetical protein
MNSSFRVGSGGGVTRATPVPNRTPVNVSKPIQVSVRFTTSTACGPVPRSAAEIAISFTPLVRRCTCGVPPSTMTET